MDGTQRTIGSGPAAGVGSQEHTEGWDLPGNHSYNLTTPKVRSRAWWPEGLEWKNK